MKKGEEIRNIGIGIGSVTEKINRCRYKLGVLQDRFAVPPGCDGWHEPEDEALLYMGVKVILDEIQEECTEASDDLSVFSRVLQEEVPA